MQNESMIAATEFCTHYNVEYSFISSLQDHGLIEITTIEEQGFIPSNDLQKLERMVRLHYDLDINLEGIEAITHLLDKLENLQFEMMQVRNRLRVYESSGFED